MPSAGCFHCWSTMQLQMLHCRSSIATYIVGRNCEGCSGIEYFVDWCITHNSGHERKGTATVHFHLLWPFPRIFLIKKAAPLQLKLGSTCAVHSKTSQVGTDYLTALSCLCVARLAKLVQMNNFLHLFLIY